MSSTNFVTGVAIIIFTMLNMNVCLSPVYVMVVYKSMLTLNQKMSEERELNSMQLQHSLTKKSHFLNVSCLHDLTF